MARQPESTPKITDPQHLLLLPELPELSWGGKGWRKSLKARIGKCPAPCSLRSLMVLNLQPLSTSRMLTKLAGIPPVTSPADEQEGIGDPGDILS